MTFRTADRSTICLDCGSDACQKHRLVRALEMAALGLAAMHKDAHHDGDDCVDTTSVEAISEALQTEIASCEIRARQRNRGEL